MCFINFMGTNSSVSFTFSILDPNVSNFSRLLPFGAGTDDLQGPHYDDSASNPFTLRVPFTFFGTEYREIIVRMFH